MNDAMDQLRNSAHEAIDNGDRVVVVSMGIGEAKLQGDIAVERIEKLPEEACEIDRPANGQVAPGSTRGSRHCIPTEGVRYFAIRDGDPLSDLAVVATAEWELEHPEHGDYVFPDGTYRLHHQQNEQRQRVLD